MVFRFLLISDEVEGFKREIQINSDENFLALHKAIVESVGYKEGEMASFFMCTDDWDQKEEVTLFEMDTDSDEDSFTMENTLLEEFLEDEKQRLMYVFDYISGRAFFMELREIITGKNLDKPVCSQSVGQAPPQFSDINEVEATVASVDTGENFYGDEEYDLTELDAEGFDGLDLPASEEEV